MVTTLQIVGFILMVLGAQGLIRLLVFGDMWLLGWLHPALWAVIVIYTAFLVAGVGLLSWAQKRSKQQ